MDMKSKCLSCKKEFNWKKQHKNYIRKFCCHKCALIFNNEKQKKWTYATEEERIEMMRVKFEKSVIKKNGCWDWKGYKDKYGYTYISGFRDMKKYHIRGNRVSWEIHYGKIPENILVCHKCDNPSCTNPEHLFLGTIRENNEDRTIKNRQSKGENVPGHILKELEVKEIKKKLKEKVCQRRIAEEYKVSYATICMIKKGKTWKHVE